MNSVHLIQHSKYQLLVLHSRGGNSFVAINQIQLPPACNFGGTHYTAASNISKASKHSSKISTILHVLKFIEHQRLTALDNIRMRTEEKKSS